MVDNEFIQERFTKLIVRKEEEVLKKALSQLLGREPQEIDWKQTTKFMRPTDPWNYHVAYNGITFGKLERELTLNMITVTFRPNVQVTQSKIQL